MKFLFQLLYLSTPDFFSLKKKLFMFCFFFWLCWIFIAVCGCSLAASWGLLFAFSSCSTRASHCSGFSCFRALSRAQAQQLWQMGLVATWHVGSSRTRDRTVSRELAGRFFTLKSPGKLLNSRFSI